MTWCEVVVSLVVGCCSLAIEDAAAGGDSSRRMGGIRWRRWLTPDPCVQPPRHQGRGLTKLRSELCYRMKSLGREFRGTLFWTKHTGACVGEVVNAVNRVGGVSRYVNSKLWRNLRSKWAHEKRVCAAAHRALNRRRQPRRTRLACRRGRGRWIGL